MTTLVTTNIATITDQAIKELTARLGTLTEEEAQIVARTINRSTELTIRAIGANSEQLTQFNNERNALVATLATLGEQRAADAQSALSAFLIRLLTAAEGVALGRLGL